MARVSKVDQCMFCGNAPCTCRSAKKAAPKPRTPRKAATAPIDSQSKTGTNPELQEPAAQKADVTAAMKAASQVKHQGSTIKSDHDAQDETTWMLNDPEFAAAIQALEPLMHLTERKRFEPVLRAVITPRDRAAAWRARRGLG